jgi:hypothetical protein
LIEGLHTGANILLAHFHYCNRGTHPFVQDWASPEQIAGAQLNAEQGEFMRESVLEIKKKGKFLRVRVNTDRSTYPLTRHFIASLFEGIRQGRAFENEYYFVSQLFDIGWKPIRTF